MHLHFIIQLLMLQLTSDDGEKHRKKLLSEGLAVSMPGRPAKFVLTQEGFEVALILAEKEGLLLQQFDRSTLPIGSRVDSLEHGGADGPPRNLSKKHSPETAEHISKDIPGKKHGTTDLCLGFKTHVELNIRDTSTDTSRNRFDGTPHSEVPRLHGDCSQSTSRASHKGALFEFWYLDRTNCRVKDVEKADTRMHPVTFETLYRVEFKAHQISHPVRRSSVTDELPLIPTLKDNVDDSLIGWMYESKVIPCCPGFASSKQPLPSTHDATLSPVLLQHITKSNSITQLESSSSFATHRLSRYPSISYNASVDKSHEGPETPDQIPQTADKTNPRGPLLFRRSPSGSQTSARSFSSLLSEGESFMNPGRAERLKPPLSRLGSCKSQTNTEPSLRDLQKRAYRCPAGGLESRIIRYLLVTRPS